MLEKLLSEFLCLYNIIGIEINTKKQKTLKLYKYLIDICLMFVLASTFAYLTHLNSIEAIISDLYIFITFLNALLKRLLLNSDYLAESMQYFYNKSLQAKNRKQEKIVKGAESISKFLFYFFTGSCIIGTILFPLIPLSQNERNYPLRLWLPFEHLNVDLYFYFFYILVSLVTAYVGLTHSCVDCLFSVLVIGIATQCELLTNQLANLNENTVSDEDIGFYACVKKHKIILKWFEEVVGIFYILMVFQYATSVIIFCSNLYLLTNFELNVGSILLFVYSIAAFCQLSLYCWSGNEIITKSDQISNGAYCSSWYKFPLNYQKDLLFFMQRCRKPMIILVGKTFPNEINSLKAILKTSWSAFMMLLRLKEK